MTHSHAPQAFPYAGHRKRSTVILLTALTLAVAAVTAVILAIDDAPVAMLVLGGYGAVSTVLLLTLVVGNVATRQLPAVRATEVDEQPAVGVRGWSLPWWVRVVSNGADAAGLVALGALAVGEGGEWTVPGVAALALASWPAGRVVLALTGRRHNTGLWVTENDVVARDGDGSYRCARADVVKVIAGVETSTVIVAATRVDRRPCPRPWRAPRGWAEDELGLDCSVTAHDPEGLATWLRAEVGVADHRA